MDKLKPSDATEAILFKVTDWHREKEGIFAKIDKALTAAHHFGTAGASCQIRLDLAAEPDNGWTKEQIALYWQDRGRAHE